MHSLPHRNLYECPKAQCCDAHMYFRQAAFCFDSAKEAYKISPKDPGASRRGKRPARARQPTQPAPYTPDARVKVQSLYHLEVLMLHEASCKYSSLRSAPYIPPSQLALAPPFQEVIYIE